MAREVSRVSVAPSRFAFARRKFAFRMFSLPAREATSGVSWLRTLAWAHAKVGAGTRAPANHPSLPSVGRKGIRGTAPMTQGSLRSPRFSPQPWQCHSPLCVLPHAHGLPAHLRALTGETLRAPPAPPKRVRGLPGQMRTQLGLCWWPTQHRLPMECGAGLRDTRPQESEHRVLTDWAAVNQSSERSTEPVRGFN